MNQLNLPDVTWRRKPEGHTHAFVGNSQKALCGLAMKGTVLQHALKGFAPGDVCGHCKNARRRQREALHRKMAAKGVCSHFYAEVVHWYLGAKAWWCRDCGALCNHADKSGRKVWQLPDGGASRKKARRR